MPPNLEPKMGPLTQRPLIFSVFLSPNAPGLRGLSLTYVSILYVTAPPAIFLQIMLFINPK